MEHGIFMSVQDFVDEGTAAILDRVTALGIRRIVLAVTYHRARDVTPRSPGRVTIRHDGAYFPPPADLFGAGSLPVPVVTRELSVAGDLVRAAHDRGLAVDGWTVFCHNTTIGTVRQDVTQRNCFGGYGAPGDLCPANPSVRQYAVDLARAAARLGVDTVPAESLHHGFFDHGYHHERSAVPLGELDRYLLGLCFCEHCASAAQTQGDVDVEQARLAAAAHLDRVLAGGSPSTAALTQQNLADVAADLAGMVQPRTDLVTSLVEEVAAAVTEEGASLGYIDLTGAVLGYANGTPTGPSTPESAWRFGIDPAAVAAHAEYLTLAYAKQPARVATDVATYRNVIGTSRPLRVVLRPGAPDTDDDAQLRAKAGAATTAGADGVDFYQYGLLTERDLDRIRTVTAEARRGDEASSALHNPMPQRVETRGPRCLGSPQ